MMMSVCVSVIALQTTRAALKTKLHLKKRCLNGRVVRDVHAAHACRRVRRWGGWAGGFKHTPLVSSTLFIYLFLYFASLLVREVGHVPGHPYLVSGKLTLYSLGEKSVASPPPPPPPPPFRDLLRAGAPSRPGRNYKHKKIYIKRSRTPPPPPSQPIHVISCNKHKLKVIMKGGIVYLCM